MSTQTETVSTPVEVVTRTLEDYASRGVFRGFGARPSRGSKATYRMMWHRDRMFELVFDPKAKSLRIPCVLPEVPADSSMYKELKAFVKSRQGEALPEHRRVDPARAEIKLFNRGGNVSLTLKVKDEDLEYGTRGLINVVHEIYLVFLYDGRYYDYMVETFDLDPDHP